ncbi:MAG: ribosome small subunit-dependent GTPase A [Methylococcales bacterium]|nr:ribosome small subunit-dependent GTPase A [Methylococcales bacterium]
MMSIVEGLVISHLGKGIAVEVDGKICLCQTRRKLDTVVVGDKVLLTATVNQQGRIDEILPRRSLLTRPSRGTKIRPVAANIDQIYVVFAYEPHCDFLLIDQYLAICENRNIDAVLVFNKQDLPASPHIEDELTHYQALGYDLHRVSAIKNTGIAALKASLKNQVSLFAGQSGVGKSSLTNTLLPDKNLKTNTVSETTKHGRHTTTAATLYHFPEGGNLIDSPGVAIFGLADLNEAQLAQGYREFQPLIEQCQFHNCAHVKDKGCAIRNAAEKKQISPARYQRFLKLREKIPRP